jgi:hypothetical protein
MATYFIRPTLEKNELSQHHNRNGSASTGGSDRIKNLVFLYPMCHQQLHWQSAKEAAFSNENDTEGLSRVRRKSHARF